MCISGDTCNSQNKQRLFSLNGVSQAIVAVEKCFVLSEERSEFLCFVRTGFGFEDFREETMCKNESMKVWIRLN